MHIVKLQLKSENASFANSTNCFANIDSSHSKKAIDDKTKYKSKKKTKYRILLLLE